MLVVLILLRLFVDIDLSFAVVTAGGVDTVASFTVVVSGGVDTVTSVC